MSALVLLADDGWHGHMAGGAWWVWMPVMLMVIAALVFVAVLSARAAHLPAAPSDRLDEGRTARAIAMERYARGEITAEEYDALVHRLR